MRMTKRNKYATSTQLICKRFNTLNKEGDRAPHRLPLFSPQIAVNALAGNPIRHLFILMHILTKLTLNHH